MSKGRPEVEMDEKKSPAGNRASFYMPSGLYSL
jgi:hypothetical protein